jgi:hypothetical protein
VENWWVDRWNEGVTPWNASLISYVRRGLLITRGTKLGEDGWEYVPRCQSTRQQEKRARGGRAYDRPGVYKIPMVRIIRNGMTNLRMYGSKARMSRNAHTVYAGCVGMSKIPLYESPYGVTGAIKHAGLEQAPKGICTDKHCRYVESYGHEC